MYRPKQLYPLKNLAISEDRNTVSYDKTNIDTFVNETSWNEINSKRKELSVYKGGYEHI